VQLTDECLELPHQKQCAHTISWSLCRCASFASWHRRCSSATRYSARSSVLMAMFCRPTSTKKRMSLRRLCADGPRNNCAGLLRKKAESCSSVKRVPEGILGIFFTFLPPWRLSEGSQELPKMYTKRERVK